MTSPIDRLRARLAPHQPPPADEYEGVPIPAEPPWHVEDDQAPPEAVCPTCGRS